MYVRVDFNLSYHNLVWRKTSLKSYQGPSQAYENIYGCKELTVIYCIFEMLISSLIWEMWLKPYSLYSFQRTSLCVCQGTYQHRVECFVSNTPYTVTMARQSTFISTSSLRALCYCIV